ncbi:hypothetical protein DIPPA_61470 [Diplonema papillatum]|nr:hypothetical protein DIPPA_61470 [Diplonema papillatum]
MQINKKNISNTVKACRTAFADATQVLERHSEHLVNTPAAVETHSVDLLLASLANSDGPQESEHDTLAFLFAPQQDADALFNDTHGSRSNHLQADAYDKYHLRTAFDEDDDIPDIPTQATPTTAG